VCFAPLARTLFFAARLFATPKNFSLGPSVPMSTFQNHPSPCCRETAADTAIINLELFILREARIVAAAYARIVVFSSSEARHLGPVPLRGILDVGAKK